MVFSVIGEMETIITFVEHISEGNYSFPLGVGYYIAIVRMST